MSALSLHLSDGQQGSANVKVILKTDPDLIAFRNKELRSISNYLDTGQTPASAICSVFSLSLWEICHLQLPQHKSNNEEEKYNIAYVDSVCGVGSLLLIPGVPSDRAIEGITLFILSALQENYGLPNLQEAIWGECWQIFCMTPYVWNSVDPRLLLLLHCRAIGYILNSTKWMVGKEAC